MSVRQRGERERGHRRRALPPPGAGHQHGENNALFSIVI